MEVTIYNGHECKDCTFVASQERIFINKEIISKASHTPLLVGIFTLTGWSGHSPFYIFKCRFCRLTSLDYPHGYTRFDRLYLRCQNCEKLLELGLVRHAYIYESLGFEMPETNWQRMKRIIKYRFSRHSSNI